ncbi:MAG: hypothetical protein IKA89_03455, partial [Anaerotignum sp.]|nr:hypothetical protein [Anaerotignum sp.]
QKPRYCLGFCNKNVLYLSRMMRKGSGNEAFPEWNPQGELCLPEENRKFRGACTAGTYLFILLFETTRKPVFELGA